MITTTVKSVLFYLTLWNFTVVDSSWQRCNAKCYYLGQTKLAFTDLHKYCRTMSAFAKAVDFGSKFEQTVTTELSTCRLNKLDGETYWINKHHTHNSVDNCRTLSFSGTDVHFKATTCLSLSNPFCETDNTNLCQTSNNNDAISKRWVRVDGQGPLYKLSGGDHTYCSAQNHCNGLHGQVARGGDYIFMGKLANELGITGQQKRFFWLASPGISCPSQQGNGLLMRYTGPLVHMEDKVSASEQYPVLCETNVTETTKDSTMQPSSQSATKIETLWRQTAMTSTTTRKPTAASTQLLSQKQTLIARMSTATTQSTRLQVSLNSFVPHSTPLQTSKQPVTAKPQSTTLQVTSSQIGSPSTPVHTYKKPVTSKAQRTTLQMKSPPIPQSQVVAPTANLLNGYTLAVSNSSEPQWLKVGHQEYFVNYNSNVYKQMGTISINYFKVLASPNGSFWTGAHTFQFNETVQDGLTYLVYDKKSVVRSSLTNQQVQSMWKELRLQRNINNDNNS